jgi:hypothetical protein
MLLVTTTRTGNCQNNNCCGFPEKQISEPYLTGEFFAPDQPLDTLTFFSNEWLTGDIILGNGGTVRSKFLKYNGLLDELFWLETQSKRTIKLDKEAIQQFIFYDFQHHTSVQFRKITVKQEIISDSTAVFAEEIYRGKVSLYLFHAYDVERRELYYRNGIPYQKVRYTPAPVYYFRLLNNRTIGLKELNRKSLYAFSPGATKEINQFLRNNRPGNYKDHTWLIRLGEFLSTIVEQ